MQPEPIIKLVDPAHQLALLPTTLRATYADINENVQRAQQTLKNLRDNHAHQTFLTLYDILNSNEKYDENIRNAAGIQLKSVAYDITTELLPAQTGSYLDLLYKLITKAQGLNLLQREYIGTAIEYFLNKDNLNLYRNQILQQILTDMPDIVLPGVMRGLLEVYMAYINSILEITDLAEIFSKTLPLLKGTAMKYLTILQSQSKHPIQSSYDASFKSQPIYSELTGVFHVAVRLFDIIEIILSRLLDEYSDVTQAIEQFRTDEELQSVMVGYLVYPAKEGTTKGIISQGSLLSDLNNQVKEFLLKILKMAYDDVPIGAVFLCVETYIVQNGRHHTESKAAEEVMMAVVDILEMQLKRPIYYQLFAKLAMEMVIKGLTYLKHTQDDQDLLLSSPTQFIETFNDSCLSFNKQFVRTKVCSLLQSLCHSIDGVINFFNSIVNVLLRCSNESQCPKEVLLLIESLKQYEIFQQSIAIKIDIGLYLLCLMQPLMKNKQISTSVNSLLLLMLDNQLVAQHQHIAIKYMYAVGAYRLHGAAHWVLQQMRISESKKIQGIHSFSQMLKSKVEPPQIAKLFTDCMVEVLDMMEPTEELFETLVLNNYSELLVQSKPLHDKCVRKVVYYMAASINSEQVDKESQAKSIAIFNMFEGIVQKEDEMMRIFELQREFAMVFYCMIQVALATVHSNRYRENIITIMSTILRRTGVLSQYQRKFAAGIFHPQGEKVTSSTLLYLNRVVAFQKNPNNLNELVDILCQLMINQEENIISQISMVLSHIIFRIRNITQRAIQIIRQLIPTMKFNVSKLRLLEVLLMSLEVVPDITYELLNQTPGWSPDNNLYQQAVLACPFIEVCLESKLSIDRKVYVMGMCRAIDCELQRNHSPKRIVLQLAILLKSFSDKAKIRLSAVNNKKRKKRAQNNLEPSRVAQPQSSPSDQEHMNEQCGHEVQVESNKVMDLQSNALMKLDHPAQQINQMEMFQNKLIAIKHTLQEHYTPSEIGLLKQIMGIFEDKQGRTRRVVRVVLT